MPKMPCIETYPWHAAQEEISAQPVEFIPATAPGEAMRWIQGLWEEWLPERSLARLQRISEDVLALFRGSFPGYRPCDTPYHDLEHTLSLIPLFCQLGAALSYAHPGIIRSRDLETGLIALLLHDSGYIRTNGDRFGTGGKYTFRHIDRGIAFSRRYMGSLGYGPEALNRVAEMIRCTGVRTHLHQIDFTSEASRFLGYALGTSDLLAQMAHPGYVEKLPLLFVELEEAYAFEGAERLEAMGVNVFDSAEALIRATSDFFETVVLRRLSAMNSVFQLLEDPQTGRNPYLDRIRHQLRRIENGPSSEA